MTDSIYRAAWVLPVTAPPVRDGFVAVVRGRVTQFGPIGNLTPAQRGSAVDLGAALLMPGFVNAHTHLELSHLAGVVRGDRGFVPWIEEQLRVRAERTPAEATEAIVASIRALEAGGTAGVADVSNSLTTLAPLVESRLHAVVLHEILGVDPERAVAIAENARATRTPLVASPPRVRVEVAAHAPHSVSRELFLQLAPSPIRSIHVAESQSETAFLRDGSGDWRGFLDRRVGPVPFPPPGLSPVQYLDSLGVLGERTLAVHCVHVDAIDADVLARRGAVAVLCPRSNEFLGNGLPPLDLLLQHGVSLALGTDSLASCDSLDVIDDARRLARAFEKVPSATLLHAATRGGAEALGWADLGHLGPGALARFAVVDIEGEIQQDPVAFLLNEPVPARGLAA